MAYQLARSSGMIRLEEYDSGDDSDDDTDDCPRCGASIYDDSERCPRCGHYLSREDVPHRGKPWWVVVGVVGCLAMVTWWILHP